MPPFLQINERHIINLDNVTNVEILDDPIQHKPVVAISLTDGSEAWYFLEEATRVWRWFYHQAQRNDDGLRRLSFENPVRKDFWAELVRKVNRHA